MLRPNVYAICGLLAGALASGWQVELFELLALWILVDLALGAWGAGLMRAARLLPWARGGPRLAPGELLGAAGGAALAILIAGRLGELAAFLTRAALTLGVVAALIGARDPERDAAPLQTGLQVALAWTLGLTRAAEWQGLLLAPGLVAGIGAWCRLRHSQAPGLATLWATRLTWAAWVALLAAARQPLLAGLVAATGLADDLHGLSPGGRWLSRGVTAFGWLGAWFLAAVAATYWAAGG